MKNKIHIGYHKTGTTFLQQLIFPSVENYRGRIYTPDRKNCNFDKFNGGGVLKSCTNIIRHFETKDGIFISAEKFSKLRHDELFDLVGANWDVLVVTREFDDLIRSRKAHSSPDFFLNNHIQADIIDQEIRDFYNPESLKKGIRHLTVLSYEKLFSGCEKEIGRLSSYLDCDIASLFLQNINIKVNATSK